MRALREDAAAGARLPDGKATKGAGTGDEPPGRSEEFCPDDSRRFVIPQTVPNHSNWKIQWRIQPPPSDDDAPVVGPDDKDSSGGGSGGAGGKKRFSSSWGRF